MRKGRLRSGRWIAQHDHAGLLEKKLQQDAGNHQHGDDLLKREEAKDGGDESQGNERAMGYAVARMNRVEEAEVIAVAGGSIMDARIAEQQRKHRSKRGPHDESGHEAAGPDAEGRAGDVRDQLQVQPFLAPAGQTRPCRALPGAPPYSSPHRTQLTKSTESRMARGIVRSGWRTSLPRKVML